MSHTADLQWLVDQGDVAALLRAVDGRCATRSWDDLVDLAARCRAAIELGKQLWPVAMHIDYRLAYEAPARYAAGVLRPGAGRFALGPLTEVAASTHEWASLAPYLEHPATAAAVAQERVIRGEDLRGEEAARPAELPLTRMPWEPDYALPVYRDREALFPAPEVVERPFGPDEPLESGGQRAPDLAAEALRAVVDAWVSQSEGRVRTATVDGDVRAAIGCLAGAASVEPITPAEAINWLQWCGASGGAHGRRRGGAAGRFAAWWAAAALSGLEWGDDAASVEFGRELGAALGELRWYRWSSRREAGGWSLRLAVHDPLDGLAWAIEAVDRPAGDNLSGS